VTDHSDAEAIEARIAALDERVASLAPPNSAGPADLREVPRRAHAIATRFGSAGSPAAGGLGARIKRVLTSPLRKVRAKVAYNAAWGEAVSTSLIDRLDRVEETVRSIIETSHSPRRDIAAAVRDSLPHPEWERVRAPLPGEAIARLLALVGTPDGLVVHADAGDGELLRRLSVAGTPTAGADPFALPGSGLDQSSAVGALWGLSPSSAEAIVLSGVTDYSTTATRDLLIALSARALQPNGLLVIVANNGSTGSSEMSEFSGGQPFSSTAWQMFVTHHGFEALDRTTDHLDGVSILAFRPRWAQLG
jgi:hypothetical protein